MHPLRGRVRVGGAAFISRMLSKCWLGMLRGQEPQLWEFSQVCQAVYFEGFLFPLHCLPAPASSKDCWVFTGCPHLLIKGGYTLSRSRHTKGRVGIPLSGPHPIKCTGSSQQPVSLSGKMGMTRDWSKA